MTNRGPTWSFFLGDLVPARMASWVEFVRVLHILGAVVWAGGAIFSLAVLGPGVKAAGDTGMKFMGIMMKRGGPARVMGPASIVTVLAGIIVYWQYDYHLDPFGTLSRAAVTIGGALGIVILVAGLAYGMPNQKKMQKIASEIGPGGPTPEQQAALAKLGPRMAKFGTVFTWLVIVVLVLMVGRNLLV